MKCLYCQESLKWERQPGWVHQDGHPYRGWCSCPGRPHPYSHDRDLNLICPTWRDDHVATPVPDGKEA